jgi:hypothetical protein
MANDDANDIRPLHCSVPMLKWGRDRGRQQWRCKVCGLRTANPGKRRLTRAEMNRRYYLKRKEKEKAERALARVTG